MQLTMTVLRCPDKVAPEARTVTGGEFHVGRGPDVDWVLPDPDRLLSKRHFAVAFRGGGWQIADTSTNGTYLNTEPDAIGHGTARSLHDGDRLRLGAYEIEIRLVDQPARDGGLAASGGSGFAAGSAGGSGQSPFGDPFSEDLLAPPPAPRRPFDEPAYGNLGVAPTGAQLPHDFDPLAPEHDEAGFGGLPGGQVQSDHSSLMEDAMIPPPIAGYTAPQAGGIIPGDDLLPDDWDKDLLEGIAPPSQTPAPLGAPVAPEPTAFSGATPHPMPPGPTAAPLASPPFGTAPWPPSGGTPPAGAMPQGTRSLAMPEAGAAASPFDASPFETPPAGIAPPRPAAEMTEPLDFTEPLAPLSPPDDVHPPPMAEPMAPVAAVAAPVVRQRMPRPPMQPAAPLDAEPFAGLDSRQGRQPQPAPGHPKVDVAASPFDEPSDSPGSERAPVARQGPRGPAPRGPATSAPAAPGPWAASPSAPRMDDGAALAAFFKGAELVGATPSDPVAMMASLGKAFRALVTGLRAVLMARVEIKSEFRIDQTMLQKRGNNPLRFSTDDDDALTALLGVGRRTEMAPAVAIEASLRDIRMHELAVMAAMQVAIRAVLEELSPDKIRAATEQGGLAVLPAQRKARAWDAYEARHATVVRALVDDFDSIFGKSFARAYERALDEIATREQQ